MATIIPKLGLQNIKDAALNDYALEKVKKITASGNFAGVTPDAATVEAKANQYTGALVKADDGSLADRAKKKALRKELHTMLTAQALDCARIAGGDRALYLTSGYEAKRTGGSPVGELGKVQRLVVEPTATIGELKIDWQREAFSQNYSVRAYTDEKNVEGSILFRDVFSPSKATLEGLPSGEKVFVDVRANGGSTGHGPWSAAAWARPR